MDNLFFQIKQSLKFFLQHKIIFFPLILLILFIFLYTYTKSIISFFTNFKVTKNLRTSRLLSPIEDKTHIRTINDIEEENYFLDSNLTLIEGMNTNLSDILLYYEFIDNISHTYYGIWKNLSVNKNTFIYSSGNADIDFYEEGKDNFLFNLKQKNCSNLSAYFSLKDGIYEDNYIDGNFTFNFENISLAENLDKNSFSIIIPNTSLSYAFGEYIDISKKIKVNNTFINITFYKKTKYFIIKYIMNYLVLIIQKYLYIY